METQSEAMRMKKPVADNVVVVQATCCEPEHVVPVETIQRPNTENVDLPLSPPQDSLTSQGRCSIFSILRSKFRRTPLEDEVKEKPFPFEKNFSRAFWKQAHQYDTNYICNGHALDGYEAFQFLRINRLKASNSDTPGVDPLAEIMHKLGDHYKTCEKRKELTEKEIVDFLSYYLNFDDQENKQNETDSIYEDLIEDGPGMHKTILHILLEEKLDFCVPMVLRLYPDLPYICTRGGDVVSGLEMCYHSDEIRDALKSILQQYPVMSDYRPETNVVSFEHIKLHMHSKPNIYMHGGMALPRPPIHCKFAVEEIYESGKTRLTTAGYSRNNVFVLFVESLQSKFARKLCSVLEIVSQGSLQVEDMESLLRSPSQNIAKTLNKANAVVMVSSPGLQSILQQDQPPSSVATGLLANTPTEELKRYFDGFKGVVTVRGQEIIYLRDGDAIPEHIKEMKLKSIHLTEDAKKFNKMLRVICKQIYYEITSSETR